MTTKCDHGGCTRPAAFKARPMECGGAIESFCCMVIGDTRHACRVHLGTIARNTIEAEPLESGFPVELIVEALR